MKRKYESIKMEILTLSQDVVRTSETFSDNPDVEDEYNLSGFTRLFS